LTLANDDIGILKSDFSNREILFYVNFRCLIRLAVQGAVLQTLVLKGSPTDHRRASCGILPELRRPLRLLVECVKSRFRTLALHFHGIGPISV
jgi:hypothetical protein